MKLRIARMLSAVALAVALPAASLAIYQQEDTGAKQKTNAAAEKAPGNNDDKKTAQKPEDKKLSQKQEPGIVLNTDLVSVTVTVTDTYGRFVTGLSKDQFEVYDDKVKQVIAHFSDEDTPVSLGIVYDVSGSMKERINRSLHALKRFVETSHDDDDFFLLAFNNRANLVQDFTVSADQLLGHLMFVQPRGSTALYDAAYLAVEKIKQGHHAKKALLIISDGQDNNSRYTYSELRKRVKESDVQIYAIGITDPASDSLAGIGRSILEEITRMTGGRAFFPNAYNEPELIEICTRIALELRHQYAIGFYPTDTQSEAKWHKVQVKVKPPKGLGRLSLDYKDGYQSFPK